MLQVPRVKGAGYSVSVIKSMQSGPPVLLLMKKRSVMKLRKQRSCPIGLESMLVESS